MERLKTFGAASVAAFFIGACSIIGASQITVTARNDADKPMLVQVIDGSSEEANPYGEPQFVPAGAEQVLTLGVPGGDWTVTVNGAHLLGASDAGSRRGELPVTLIAPAAGAFPGGPYWEAPVDWKDGGPSAAR